MLTKKILGAVNGLVTCICRSLAGNMEQIGAEVEILHKKKVISDFTRMLCKIRDG
jgi:hypothetical protein